MWAHRFLLVGYLSMAEPLPLPDAVLKVEHSQACPVARVAVVVVGEQEVAVRVGLHDLTADADAVEERAAATSGSSPRGLHGPPHDVAERESTSSRAAYPASW